MFYIKRQLHGERESQSGTTFVLQIASLLERLRVSTVFPSGLRITFLFSTSPSFSVAEVLGIQQVFRAPPLAGTKTLRLPPLVPSTRPAAMKYIVPLLWMRWKPDRKWVHRTPLTVILILEFGILTTLFGLTGYAEPNTYRDNLRQDGALSGFNKFPGVNGYTESLPPQVYRLSTTMFALYWTLTSFFMLVLKVVLRLLSYLPPSWAAAQAIVFAVVWIFDAILLQAGASAPSDDRPWWVTRSCERAYYRQNQHYCVQSKAILGLTVCVIVLYLTTAGLAIWSMRKNRMSKGKEPEEAAAQVEEDDENIDPYLVTPRRSRAQSMVGPPQPTPNRQTFQLEGREDTSLVGKMKRAKDEIIADIM